jgi:uncharacterized protein YjbI with pentapeptide repeats
MSKSKVDLNPLILPSSAEGQHHPYPKQQHQQEHPSDIRSILRASSQYAKKPVKVCINPKRINHFWNGIVLFSCLLLHSNSAYAVSGGGLDYANLDITGQDFSNANYKGKDFTQVIAKGTNFQNSNLQGCRFYKAFLVREPKGKV